MTFLVSVAVVEAPGGADRQCRVDRILDLPLEIEAEIRSNAHRCEGRGWRQRLQRELRIGIVREDWCRLSIEMLTRQRRRREPAPRPGMPGQFDREAQPLEILRAEIAALPEGEPVEVFVVASVVQRNPDPERPVVGLPRTEIGAE